MRASFRLLGATAALAERTASEVAFRGGWASGGRGFDVVLRGVPDGLEDFIYFDVAPAEPRVSYRIDVAEAAGLRLVEGVLELLDAEGAPRLRVRRPYLIDASGARHEASLRVRGCAFDESPLPPWDRAVTPPGAATCDLDVEWDAAVPYPAALDPAWVDGGTMVYPRNGHAAALLANGKVLVPGGWLAIGATNYTNVAEIFDPTTKTWAATTAMNRPRAQFVAVTFPSGPLAGKVLASAGDDGMQPTAEIYDPATATWANTSAMKSHRDEGAATLLANGKVLVAGGCTSYNSSTCLSLGSSAEVFDPATGTWTASANAMSDPRWYFTLSPLADGRALGVGGCKAMTSGFLCFNSSNTADIYDPSSNSWTLTATLPIPIQLHVGVTLSTGKVLIAGGINNGTIHRKSMLFDPTAGTWTTTGDLPSDHDVAAAVALPNGRALIAGSWGTQANTNQVTGYVDVFDSATSAWSPGVPMKTPHGDHSATTLQDGRILVAGGFGQGAGFTLTESSVGEIYDDNAVPTCAGTPTLDANCSACAKSLCCSHITACNSSSACAAAMGCFAYCGAQKSSLDCLLKCSCLAGDDYNAFKMAAYCISQVECAASCGQVTGSGGAPACGSGGTGGSGGTTSGGGSGGATGGTGGATGGSGGATGGVGGATGGAGGSTGGVGGASGGGAGGSTGGVGGASGGAGSGGVTTGGTGGSSGGATGTGGFGGVSTGGTSAGGDGAGSDDGGCGCATPRGSSAGAWLVLALALALGGRRRRDSAPGGRET